MDEQRELLLQQENRVNVSGCGGDHDPSNGHGNVTIAFYPMYHNIMESTGLVGGWSLTPRKKHRDPKR